MPAKNIKLAVIVVLTCCLTSQVSYSQAVSSENIEPTKKVTKLDNLIRKVYLMAGDFFDDNNKPNKAVFENAADEVVADANGDASKKADEKDTTPKKDAEPKLDNPPVLADPILEEPVFEEPTEKIGDALKEKSKEVGGVAGILEKRSEETRRAKQKSTGSSISPLYWQNLQEEHRKKLLEQREKERQEKEERDKLKDLTEIPKEEVKEDVIVPVTPEDMPPRKKPNENYRTELLPSAISKKEYDRDNSHLPSVVYDNEYRKIMFDSAAVGNLDVLRAMIERLGTTEIRDSDGNTPLLYAVMAGNLKSVVSLASRGANLNLKNSLSVSPLYAATKVARHDMMNILLRKGADPDIEDKNGETPLMLAAKANDIKAATMLVKKGANVNERNKLGDTALNIAAKNNASGVVSLLLANEANVENVNLEGQTPLLSAAGSGASEAANVLIKAGADTSKKDARGIDATKIAAQKGYTGVAESIDSANVRRELDKATKAAEVVKPVEEVVLEKVVSHKIQPGEIPIPELRPFIPKDGKVPQPKFSEEEKAKM